MGASMQNICLACEIAKEAITKLLYVVDYVSQMNILQ